ncbi:DUF1836 domain-containing protein [Streptococcus caprae]|uniref:DUF1836 domain-containing protein n=1 Tax=Streptococcus caprae TaxID=1640501 RepID=A0ABV8CUP9_9STRE
MTIKNYPLWSELPELELYLDQVLLYVNQVCKDQLLTGDKGLTAAMVNNYVKLGSLAKPVKKKYNRQQIARLIVITTLKNVFRIQEISPALTQLTDNNQSEVMYNHFVQAMSGQNDQDIPKLIKAACETALSYQYTYRLLQELETQHES